MSHVGNTGRPRRVIVSGGIGSGKTTVLAILARLGAVVIEADRIGHEVLAPEGPAFAAVAQRWPQVVVGGHIDRGRLAAIVFSDGDELEALEGISHPLIFSEIRSRVARAENRDVALELPVGDGFGDGEWTRIVVIAAEEVRRARAVERGMEPEDIAGRIAAQRGDPEWIEEADIVIENNGSFADLEARVVAVWEQLAAAS